MFFDVGQHYGNMYRWFMSLEFNRYFTVWGFLINRLFGNIYDRLPNQLSRFHPFHILGPSPWPICVSISVLLLVSGIIDFLTLEQHWGRNVLVGFFSIAISLWGWWVDVIHESLVEHTVRIKFGIAIGMILFIVSEIMFFFSFFWGFFHVSLAPGIELGCVWPPKGIESIVIDPFGAPLVNTFILVISGLTITCVHHAFLVYCVKQRRVYRFLTGWVTRGLLTTTRDFFKMRPIRGYEWHMTRHSFWVVSTEMLITQFNLLKNHIYFFIISPSLLLNPSFICLIVYFIITLFLALLFTTYQMQEYLAAAVCLSDGVYGSTFFMLTGFHGFHVIVGTLFLFICFLRILLTRISYVKSIGLECAIWYWHFVDVVWLFLFIFLYVWGNGIVPVISLEDVAFSEFVANADYARRWQFGFQSSATVLMEGIVDLHNYIMLYICFIFGVVSWLLFACGFLQLASRFGANRRSVKAGVRYGRVRELVVRRFFFAFNPEAVQVTGRWLGWVRDRSLRPHWKKFFLEVECSFRARCRAYDLKIGRETWATRPVPSTRWRDRFLKF